MKPKYKRLLQVTALLLIMALGAFALLKTFGDNLVYYYSPSDLKKIESEDNDKFNDLEHKKIRVGGLIKDKSLNKDKDKFDFVVTDNNYDIKIYYEGILPPMFREGQGVVAEGNMIGKIKIVEKTMGIKDIKKTNKATIYQFKASKLITKHDEKYMPPEVAKSLKKKHAN